MPITILLDSERNRDMAIRAIERTALDGRQEVVIRRQQRTRKQNNHLHGQCTELAKQMPWPPPPLNSGTMHDVEWWKRRMTLAWLKDKKEGVEVIVDLEGEEWGMLIPHTSDLTAPQANELIEFIYSFGAPLGVVFKEPKDYEGLR